MLEGGFRNGSCLLARRKEKEKPLRSLDYDYAGREKQKNAKRFLLSTANVKLPILFWKVGGKSAVSPSRSQAPSSLSICRKH